MRSLAVAGIVAALLILLLLPSASPHHRTAATGSAAPSSDELVPQLATRGIAHPLAQSCSALSLCAGMVRHAYNFSAIVNASATNGTGQTVVIVDACGDPTIKSDLHTFDLANGLSDPVLTVTPYGAGPACTNGRWSLETALDVEWAHVMAPGADIHLLVAAKPNNTDMFGAWDYALTNALGSQISNSWGGHSACGSMITGHLKAARTGHVTVLASAGDTGAWGSGTFMKSQDPADCAQVLSVGGTTLTLASGGGYGSEKAWAGSGGGYVTGSKEPAYQATAKIPDSYGTVAKPDVAAVADPGTGVWVYDHGYGGWVVVGGTSVACPLWAGFVADANALRASHGFGPLGAFNPYLYGHVYGISGGSANYSRTIHDVTSGSNGWSAGTGWDAATGIGSFNGGALVAQLGNDRAA